MTQGLYRSIIRPIQTYTLLVCLKTMEKSATSKSCKTSKECIAQGTGGAMRTIPQRAVETTLFIH